MPHDDVDAVAGGARRAGVQRVLHPASHLAHRVMQLIAEVSSKQGARPLINFDALSDLVIDEHKTEATRNYRYLEAIFNAADVDG